MNDMARILYIFLLSFFSFNVLAQNTLSTFTVKGTVVDTSGEPVIGATVKIKDTTTATITDVNGSFSRLVSGKDVKLVASFIGYQSKEITVKKGETPIRFVLADTEHKKNLR